MLAIQFTSRIKLLLLNGLIIISACTTMTSNNADIQRFPAANEDPNYWPIISSERRQASIVTNFETRHIVQTYLLNDKAVQALTQRQQMILGRVDSSIILDSQKNLSFFVSSYALRPEENYLENNLLWSLELEFGGQKLRPIVTRFLSNKSYNATYFDGINDWSRDYFISFAIDPKLLNNTTDSSQLILTMANRDGAMKFTW